MKVSVKYKRISLANSMHFAAGMLETAASQTMNRYDLDKTGNRYLSESEREYLMKLYSRLMKDARLMREYANKLKKVE